jgi:hypothetical protein
MIYRLPMCIISVMLFTHCTNQSSSNGGINYNVVSSGSYINIASTNNVAYLAYAQYVAGSSRLVVNKTANNYDVTNIKPVGNILVNDAVDNVSLAINSTGNPVVAYRITQSQKLDIQEFDGKIWQHLGSKTIPQIPVSFISLVIDKNNTPYLAYTNLSTHDCVDVIAYQDDSWQNIGQCISVTPGYWSSLAMKDNQVLLAYQDYVDDHYTKVLSYQNNIWQKIGTESAVTASAYYQHLAVSPQAKDIYLSYQDWSSKKGISVKKFNTKTNSWDIVGYPNISDGEAIYPTLAFSNTDIPYLLYSNFNNQALTFNPIIDYFNLNTNKWELVYDYPQWQYAQYNALVITDNNMLISGFNAQTELNNQQHVLLLSINPPYSASSFSSS